MNNNKRMKTFYLDEKTVADIEATASFYGISQSSVVAIAIAQSKKVKKSKEDDGDKLQDEAFDNQINSPYDESSFSGGGE